MGADNTSALNHGQVRLAALSSQTDRLLKRPGPYNAMCGTVRTRKPVSDAVTGRLSDRRAELLNDEAAHQFFHLVRC